MGYIPQIPSLWINIRHLSAEINFLYNQYNLCALDSNRTPGSPQFPLVLEGDFKVVRVIRRDPRLAVKKGGGGINFGVKCTGGQVEKV